MTNAGSKHPVSSPMAGLWRCFRLGAILAVMSATVAAVSDLKEFLGLVGQIATFGSEALMAGVNRSSWARNRIATGQLEKLFQQPVCNVATTRIDMDGNGMAADLAVHFTSFPIGRPTCTDVLKAERDVAFYRWSSTGYVYAGNPPMPSGHVALWKFHGPVFLRVMDVSDTPPIEVFSLGPDKKIEFVGFIGMFNEAEHVWFDSQEIADGAFVNTPTGLWRISRQKNGKTLISHAKLGDLTPHDFHARLLSFENGILKLDDKYEVAVATTRSTSHGEAEETSVSGENVKEFGPIIFNPLDRLYLSGCSPRDGLKPHPELFAAYTIDHLKGGMVFCATNEEGGGFHVRITFEHLNAQ